MRPKKFLLDWALPAWFLSCALLFALSSLCVILNFGLRQPTFDQYKEYGNYLSQPFLTSMLMIEPCTQICAAGHAPSLRKRGFDGYIRDYHADNNYRLVLLQPNANRVLLLKQLDLR